MLEKKADALLGGADDQYFPDQAARHRAGRDAADWEVNIVGMTIVMTDPIAKNPDLVRRFGVRVGEVLAGEQEADPGAAVDAALKVKPDLNR